MMRSQPQFKWYTRTIGLVLGILLTGFLTMTVHANGIHPVSQEVYSDEIGPYILSVTTSPVLDFIHLGIYLSLKDSDSPVLSANLTVAAEQADGTGIAVGPMAAPLINDNLNWFSVDLPIEEAGEWTVTLIIDAPLAKETVTFPIFVRGSGGVSTTFMVIVVATAVPVVLWWGRRLKIDRHHK